MVDHEFVCCLCGKTVKGWGNNPYPLKKELEECCDDCNMKYVVPARIRKIMKEGEKDEKRTV